jgi:hypothetical protein
MDSIHKKYPFGSLLFWRTKELLKFDRKLGPFELPDPKADYPIDYVLDGQQRITSIFCAFQTEMGFPEGTLWLPIYFDLDAESTAQETQFVALSADKVDLNRHFPLSALFDIVAYRKATEKHSGETLRKIDKMQEIFKEAKIPVQTSGTTDKATVAIIFERVNRQGVRLDTLQLLSAWTWSEEFQLQDQFAELADELVPFGFDDVGEDTNLLLRCCSAILKKDSSPQALMSISGVDVRNNFDRVTNGVKYAVDYLRSNFHSQKLKNLPYTTLLVPLSVFFAYQGTKQVAATDSQRKKINQWFWRSSFSRRYSSGVIRNLNTDIAEMEKLRVGQDSNIGEFSVEVNDKFFLENSFGINNVNTKTFILLLASQRPLSFVSGSPIDLATTLKEANRNEFHHLMPKQFLKLSNQTLFDESALANFCLLSRADNGLIAGAAPSKYRSKMPLDVTDIMKKALIPDSLFNDDYPAFVTERATIVSSIAARLCNLPT